MATTTTITKMLFRRGNDADRQQTILASGEPGWCLDTNRLWIGDGVTPGGYPALSACEEHLQYEPIGLPSPQTLNINIPGLTRTTTSQWANGMSDQQLFDADGKYLYPANQNLKTYYDIHFMDAVNPGVIKHQTKNSGTSLKIDCLPGSSIDIGDGALVIEKDVNDVKTVKIELNTAIFEATKAIFDAGVHTHFEDKTIDLNVVYVDPTAQDPTPAPEGQGSSSNDTGLYFAHNNYLSAGYMRIGTGQDEYNACSVLEFCPTVYKQSWDSGLSLSPHRGYVELDGNNVPYNSYTDENGADTSSSTSSWEGGGILNASNRKAPKHVRVHSPRPDNKDSKGYDGYANLVLESGLISYGPGDPTTGDYNAYKINQSLDTNSHPTFQGLTIQSGGAPIPVTSGGTGKDSLAARGVIHTPSGTDEGPLQSLVLGEGDFVVGTTAGINKIKITDGATDYVAIASDPATGRQTFTNKFSPGNFSTGDTVNYVNKWYQIDGDSGTITPGSNVETLAFDGVTSSDGRQYVTTIVNRPGGGSSGAGRIQLKHTSTGDTDALYALRDIGESEFVYADSFSDLIDATDDGSGSDTTSPAGSIDTGLAIGAVKINGMGHLEGIRSKDFDTRYAKYLNMGTNARKTTPVNSPSDMVGDILTPTIPGAADRTYFDDVTIAPTTAGVHKSPYQLLLNDYGTLHSISAIDLNDYYLTKDQIVKALADLADGIDGSRTLINGLDTRLTSLEDEVEEGVEKIKVTYNTLNEWYPITFAEDDITGFTPLGGDKLFIFNPSTHTLWSQGPIQATSFHGDGAGLTNLSDVVYKSTGGTFNGGLSISEGNGVIGMGIDAGWIATELQAGNGSYYDFKSGSGNSDYDARFLYHHGTYQGQADAFRFYIRGGGTVHNAENEVLRICKDYMAVAGEITCATELNIACGSSGSATEGAQINLADARTWINGETEESWSIDNYKDTAGNGGHYKLGTNMHLLRMFRHGAGWVVVSEAGDVKAKGDIIAYGASDKRLKKKIKPISDPLAKISQIGGYNFEWNEKKPSARQGPDVGVIAQEIEKILPEIVEERDDDLKTKAVRYEKIIPLLIEGIKELTEKVEYLEAKLEGK